MPPDEQALLAAIAAAPDDDLPRLVYADWLDEHGRPERAEFIRLLIELSQIGFNPARRRTLVKRLRYLRKRYGCRWWRECERVDAETGTRTYHSPDGVLCLQVITGDDGDMTFGFDGYEWHAHASDWAAASGQSAVEAVESFVRELLTDKFVVAVFKIDGRVNAVWVTDDPVGQVRRQSLSENETVELRFWDGLKWEVEWQFRRRRVP